MSVSPDSATWLASTQVDVLVVGFGPVGQMLSILLAQKGHTVLAVDRYPRPYPQPRAVHFDDEIMRNVAAVGVAEGVRAVSQPSGYYDWQNAAGEMLIHFDWSAPGAQGWPSSNMFAQPELEKVLAKHAVSLDNVTLKRGVSAVGLAEQDDHVVATLRDSEGTESTVTARYVVGCDGANSFVRDCLGTTMTDLGFHYDWLILDVIPHEHREWKPMNVQICDPVQPTTMVSGGPGRRRWEFMRLPGETIEELNTEATAWRLLSRWGYTPENADLERHAVYTFQARWVDQWRSGRLAVAGDAAHLMPPFAGQGMCSGVRDAANLAWKLDLVLRGLAREELLDTYTSERSAHIQHAIHMSVELGNVICISDPEQAAVRDAHMLGAGGRPDLALPPLPPEVLGHGVLHTSSDGALVGRAGQLVPQGRVTSGGLSDRFDQVIGTGFVLLSLEPIEIAPEIAQGLSQIGTRLVALQGSAEGWVSAHDDEGVYTAWLEGMGARIALVRPDFYLFGAATAPEELPALATQLLDKLGTPSLV